MSERPDEQPTHVMREPGTPMQPQVGGNAVPAGSQFDPATGLYVDPATGAHYDPAAQRYLTPSEVHDRVARAQQAAASGQPTRSGGSAGGAVGWALAVIVAIAAIVGFGLWLTERDSAEDLRGDLAELQDQSDADLGEIGERLDELDSEPVPDPEPLPDPEPAPLPAPDPEPVPQPDPEVDPGAEDPALEDDTTA